MKLEWTAPALHDRIEIFQYIARDSVAAATKVDDAFDHQVEQLLDHPTSGRLGKLIGTRELVVHGLPYIVVYDVNLAIIRILRVIHTSRDWRGKEDD